MNYVIRQFDGMIPAKDPRQLSGSASQIAENMDLLRGNITAITAPSLVQALNSDTESVYYWNGAWQEWASDVDVVENPIDNDAYDRIHLTGDGTPKVYGVKDSVEYKLDLGVPQPTNAPTGVAVQKPAGDITWTRTWRYHYEDKDVGTIYQEATLVEGVDVIVDTPGKAYHLDTLPAKIAGTPTDARFVLWFAAFDQYGSDLGRVYPDISEYSNVKNRPGSSDLYIEGAYVTALQETEATTPNATFTLQYNTSRASDYKVERAYVYTFKSIFGEEGPPSEASEIVAIDPSQNCTVANFDTSVTGNYNITHIKIYRTVTDSNGHAAYQYVTEIALGTTSYLDQLKDSTTGEIILSDGWFGPPADLAGIVMHPSGAAVGFSGNTLWFSEPNYLHAWPIKYQQTVKDPIVAIGVTEKSVIVATTKAIIVVSGSHPDSMSSTNGTLQQPCSNKLGMVDVDGTIVYPCPDGLVGYKGHDGALLSEQYYNEDQWRDDVVPENMIAAVHDGTYYAWSGSVSVIFDFSAPKDAIRQTTELAVGLHADRAADKLYLIQENATTGNRTLTLWRGGSTYLRNRWHGRQLLLGRDEMPIFVRVVADSYTLPGDDRSDDDVTVNFYANGVLVKSLIIYDDDARLVPDLRREKQWSFEVTSKTNISELSIAPSEAMMQQVTNE